MYRLRFMMDRMFAGQDKNIGDVADVLLSMPGECSPQAPILLILSRRSISPYTVKVVLTASVRGSARIVRKPACRLPNELLDELISTA
jgi:hypothetical protein